MAVKIIKESKKEFRREDKSVQRKRSLAEEKLSWSQQMDKRTRINGDSTYFIVGSIGRTRFNDAEANDYWDREDSSWLFTDGNKIIRIGGDYSPNADETYTVIVDRDARYSEVMHNARWIPEDHAKHPTYFFD